MNKMSEAARTALINARGGWQGAPTGAVGPTMRELFTASLIGPDGGLTRKGTIVRERLMNAELEKAFG